jgi:hypothetical protein
MQIGVGDFERENIVEGERNCEKRRTREKKNDFVIKRGGRFSCVFKKSHVFLLSTVILSFLVHCLFVLILVKPVSSSLIFFLGDLSLSYWWKNSLKRD